MSEQLIRDIVIVGKLRGAPRGSTGIARTHYNLIQSEGIVDESVATK